SNGEAAVVDPLRDVDSYIQFAAERNAVIKYIFETHFHADFVSGHLDLAKATGATIVYGPDTETALPVYIAKDREVFPLGNLFIETLHTPGHTLESTCYLLKDEQGKDYCVFTGDTLFVGDVGRPDLAQQGAELKTDDLAALLYDSLQEKLMLLADEVIVYPAHGPGSACGKALGPNTFSTIGEEKQTNYALQAADKEAFVQAVTDGLTAPPLYFPINVQINKEGYDSIDDLFEKGLKPLTVAEIKELVDGNALVVDTRPAPEFTQGFVPGAIFVGLEGRFAEWAGSILPFDKDLILVCEPGKEKEAVTRLARVGFSKMAGYLAGGMDAWKKAGESIDMIIDIEADELAMDIPFDPNLIVLDVRRSTEFADGHVKGAINLPLNEMVHIANLAQFGEEQNIYVHCAGGYRSVVAASLLKRQGLHNLRNVLEGWGKIKEQEKISTEKESSLLN
ncbi:MAG TPA: MBL fold metallo-hydrolase, partial [Flavisolibacter sp.]|nr:MBL fold metallo-hydrolase [Flavisolibacter sp.]